MKENADIKDFNAWRILINFLKILCIYLGEGRGGGGRTNACIPVCMGTHCQPLLQNRLMDVYKTW